MGKYMDYVILGLLCLNSLTAYDLNKAFKSSISLFYAASLGSIQSALKKLSKKDWISSLNEQQGGRSKRIYSPTENGRKAFNDWLSSSVPIEKVKDPALTRLFFLGLSQDDVPVTVIQNHLNSINADISKIKFLMEKANHSIREIKDPELKRIVKFQYFTLKYGIAFHQFNYDWYSKLLKDELS